MKSPDNPGRVPRGLLLIGLALAIGIAISLVGTALVQWLLHRASAQTDGYRSMVSAQEVIDWVHLGGALRGALLMVGCWLLMTARGGERLPWTRLALFAAGARLATIIVLFALDKSSAATEGTFRLLVVMDEVASLVLFGALGLAVRRLMGGRVSAMALWLWPIGLGWDAFIAVLDVVEHRWLAGDGDPWILLYAISISVDLSRVLLIGAAWRALARRAPNGVEASGTAALDGDGLRLAGDGLSLYRGALIVRIVVAAVGILAIGAALVGRGPASLGSLGLFLPVVEAIAAVAMVIGLVRYAANLPGEVGAGPAAVAGVICTVIAGGLQLNAYSIVMRIQAYTEASSRATGLWDAPVMGDLMEVAARLPWIELAASTIALVGLCLVLRSLRTLARWLGQPELESRAALVTAGLAVLVAVSAGIRWYAATVRHPSIGLVLVLGIAALAGALVLFTQYLGVLRDLIEALRGQRPAVPPARVVSDGADRAG